MTRPPAVPIAAAASAPVEAPSTSWWQTSTRRLFLDAHTPDPGDPHQPQLTIAPDELFAGADPERNLSLIAAAGADSVVLFAKCQYGNSYFPTRVGRQHSGLNGRDLFGEQLQAAHRRGLRAIAYFSNMWDAAAAGAHPAWRLVPLPGREGGRWPAVCLQSGYQEYALAHVREIAERYPIDGLWSDILTAGPCCCERCRAGFEERFGLRMPERPADPGWLNLVHYTQDILQGYLARQSSVLLDARPQAAFIPNYYATAFVDAATGLAPTHLDLADIGSSEGYTDWHGLGFPSFAASSIRSGMLDGPHEVLVSRFVHTWDFTMRSAAQLRFEAFSAAARGATVSVDDQPYADGGLEPEVYRRLRTVFDRIREREPWVVGGEPVRYAAFFNSQAGRELESALGTRENPSVGDGSAQYPPSEPRSGVSDFHAAVSGTYRALVESHLPVGFFDERPASLATLGQYKVLVLADALCLSEEAVAAIAAFVRSGGGLVVTGPPGELDQSAQYRTSRALADLVGVTFEATGGRDYQYLCLSEPLAEAVGGWPLPHYGRIPALQDVPADAEVLACRVDAVLQTDETHYWHNNQPAPLPRPGTPAIVARRWGAGRVVVSAGRLGNNHARLGHGGYRDLLGELVRYAAGVDPEVEIIGSHHDTELVLTRLPTGLAVHLVTGRALPRLDIFGAQQTMTVEDVAETPSLKLRVPPATMSAVRIVDGREVALELVEGVVEVRDADDWETIVLR